MRKFLLLIFSLAVVVSVYVGYAHFSGGAIPTFGLPIGGAKKDIRHTTKVFFENVKFKNHPGLKQFVREEDSLEQIGAYLNTIFGISVDQVDLDSIEVDSIELDTSKIRARVRVHIKGLDLVNKAPLSLNKIIFLYRSGGKWMIDINNLSP